MNRPIRFAVLLFSSIMLFNALATAQDGMVFDFYNDDVFDPDIYSAQWSTEDGEIRFWPNNYELGSVADTPGNACRHVALMGRHAIVSDGNSGLQVMDISDSRYPSIIGSFNTPGYSYMVHIEGNIGYVADHSGGLRIIDFADPTNPVELGSESVPGVALGVFVQGQTAYVGAGNGGLVVINVSDPANPFTEGIYNTPGQVARQVHVQGDLALVTDGDNGLLLLDVTDPPAPFLVGHHLGQGNARDLEVDGDLVYLSRHGFGLEILDITIPSQPVLVGSLTGAGTMRGLDLEGERVFQANDGLGVRVIDVSDPADPFLIETINTPGFAYDIQVNDAFAYVCDLGPGLQVLQVSHRTDPFEMSAFNPTFTSGTPSLSGPYVYSPAGPDGVMVTDLSDPANPVSLGSVGLTGYGMGTFVDGDYLYVASQSNGLTVMDISDPQSPEVIGSMDSSGTAWDVAVSGHFAFLADGDRLTIMNVAIPSDPIHVGIYYSSILARRVIVDGNRAFLFDPNGNSANLEILDLTFPWAPSLIGTIAPPHAVAGIDVQGNDLYVAGGNRELMIYDISNPASPQLRGEWDNHTGVSRAVAVVGDRAYVAVDDKIFQVNVEYPSSPFAYDSMESGYFMQLIRSGDHLLARGVDDGNLNLYRIKQHEVDTSRPQIRSHYIDTGETPIIRARLNSVHDGLVNWAFDVDGENGQYVFGENEWFRIYQPGTQIRWEANLQYFPGTLSTVSELKVDWLYDAPKIEWISDIANDQGRQVSLEWSRSGHDFIGDENQIVQYAVYRRIDGDLMAEEQVDKSERSDKSVAQGDAALDHNVQLMSSQGWHYLTTLPVLVQDRYAVVVPTLADSTASGGDYDSVFQVVALTATPGVFYTSQPDSGSSVDNLAPGVPQGITANYGPGSVDLLWEDSADTDFRFYRVYRDTDPNFIPGMDNLIQEVATPEAQDDVSMPGQYVYKVSAVDFSGNESDAGAVAQISEASLPGPALTLNRAVPNPFNPSTRLSFTLAETGPVQLTVYDLAGRRVRTLVNEVLESGSHQLRWDGRNQSGQLMASGAYFAVLRQGGEVRKERLMLMK